MEITQDMKTINDFITAIDDEKWADNSENELSYLLSEAATFTQLDEGGGETTMQFVDVGDRMLAMVVYSLKKQ